MPVVVCECGARNTAGGDCIKCGRGLGSIPRALMAAAVSAVALAVGWAVFIWLTRFFVLWFLMLFGIGISGAVVQASFGRGWSYQAIASAATIASVVLGHALLVVLVRDRLDLLFSLEQPNVGLLSVLAAVLEDQTALVFSVVGVMGGFWVWKQPSGDE